MALKKKKKKKVAMIWCLLFIARVQRFKNQMFEVEVTSVTIIHKAHIKNFCFLFPSTLGLGALEVPVPIMGTLFPGICVHSSDELSLSSPHQHFGLLVSLSQHAEKETIILGKVAGFYYKIGSRLILHNVSKGGLCLEPRRFSGRIV